MNRRLVTVIIPCREDGAGLSTLLGSLAAQGVPPAAICVVQLGATPIHIGHHSQGTLTGRISHLTAGGESLGAAVNRAVLSSSSDLLMLLRPHTTLDCDYVRDLLQSLDQVAGGTLLRQDPSAGSGPIDDDPAAFVVRTLATGAVDVHPVFTPELWRRAGGFDQGMDAESEVDFWLTAVERGSRVVCVSSPSLPAAPPRAPLLPSAMGRLYRKRSATMTAHLPEILEAKQAYAATIARALSIERGRLEQVARECEESTDRLAQALAAVGELGLARTSMGELRRTHPISQRWGADRGLPIDRHYIHQFLDRHRADIRGRVLEIKEATYTRLFGGDRVTASEVLDVEPTNPHATVIADLTQADAIPDESFDCLIVTQTLNYVFDVPAALRHLHRILKPGGVLLGTVAACGRLSPEGPGRDGDFWRFTRASLGRLFAERFRPSDLAIESCGNVLLCAAFLFGLSVDEFSVEELAANDPDFPLVLMVRAVKATAGDIVDRSGSATVLRSLSDGDGADVVLMYHQISDHAGDVGLSVRVRYFAEHLEMIARTGWRVVPLNELMDARRRRRGRTREIAITFDDGYLDALTHAAPELERMGFASTFFVVTGMLDDGAGEFWWDMLDRVFAPGTVLPEELDVNLGGRAVRLPVSTPTDRLAAKAALREQLLAARAEERAEVVQTLIGWQSLAPGPADHARVMVADDLLRLSRFSCARIGAHSKNHLWLPAQSMAVRRDEIADSRMRLRSLLDREVTAFSYPYGAHDFETANVVAAAGYEVAVTTMDAPLRPDTDPYRIPRIHTPDVDGDGLARRLSVFAR